jgi:hypothetical protein
MATEARRACGYRKINGLYLVGGQLGAPCDRLPYKLDRCRTCGGGVKFTRAHTWLQPDFFPAHATNCTDHWACPICGHGSIRVDGTIRLFGPHLLLWVGRSHYSPESFLDESRRLGVSRRIPAVPKGMVLGETWVLLAHLDAVPVEEPRICARCGLAGGKHLNHPDSTIKEGMYKGGEISNVTFNGKPVPPAMPCDEFQAPKPSLGIFSAFVPRAVELILKQSDATPERVEKEGKRGVTVVAVPDGDQDHQGSVWDEKNGGDSQEELPGVQP